MLYLQKSTEKTGTKRVPGISETAHVKLEYGGEREGYIAYIYNYKTPKRLSSRMVQVTDSLA